MNILLQQDNSQMQQKLWLKPKTFAQQEIITHIENVQLREYVMELDQVI